MLSKVWGMIRLEQLTKTYSSTVVLDGLNFAVSTGEIFAVVGPSGAGKSTLASCATLLERPTSGAVIVNGENLTDLGAHHLRVARRRIGTIFQSDGLFSRRTAAQNVSLPLEYLGVTKGEARARVAELLDRVGLTDKAGHYPHQLSGGQRQRVGIARALALRPSVLLSDEATSGLDPDSTASIVSLLRQLRDELGLSILFITHEMETVIQVADSVARLDHGCIIESGAVVDLLRDPTSALGLALRPQRAVIAADDSDQTWAVTYTAPDVPADWLIRAARELAVPLSLLSASVGTVAGSTVGSAVVGAPFCAAGHLPQAFARLGLDARLVALQPAAVLESVA